MIASGISGTTAVEQMHNDSEHTAGSNQSATQLNSAKLHSRQIS